MKLEAEDHKDGKKCLYTRAAEAKCGGTLASDFDRAYHLSESILPDGAIVGDLLDIQQTSVGSKADLPQSGQVLQAFSDREVARVVDCRFGAQGASFFVILLDSCVLVVDVQRRNDTFGDDTRTKPPRRSSADFPIKDELHLTRAPEVEIFPNDLLKEHAPCDGPIQHLSEGELRLQDRNLVAVPGPAISRGERMRQFAQPFPQQTIYPGSTQPIADRL